MLLNNLHSYIMSLNDKYNKAIHFINKDLNKHL